MAALLEGDAAEKNIGRNSALHGEKRNQKTALSRDVHPHGHIWIIGVEDSTEGTGEISRNFLVLQQERACKSKFPCSRAHVRAVQIHQDWHVIHPLSCQRE